MDGLTFLSNLIRDLAWPTAMLVAILIGLRKMPSLARFVKAIRYKDFELTMRENFLEARVEAEKVKLSMADTGVTSIEQETKVLQLAKIDPAIAVIEIWRKLEGEITKLIQHNGLMRFTNPVRFVEHLRKLDKLSESEVNLIRRLREIRNESVHAHDMSALTLAEVIEFSGFVDVLVKKLEQIRDEPGYIDIPK